MGVLSSVAELHCAGSAVVGVRAVGQSRLLFDPCCRQYCQRSGVLSLRKVSPWCSRHSSRTAKKFPRLQLQPSCGMVAAMIKPPPSAPVPLGRARRFLHLGRAVGEMAASATAQGLRQWAKGEQPQLRELLLTPTNARRLATRLSALRGAAMKLGQLMSMDGQGVLPGPFAELLGGLRDRAQAMPTAQLMQVLKREYGARWPQRFRSFDETPVAAASIGQVHRAQTSDGRWLALKIQFPGIRQSIHSDINNLALLARTPGLLPAALDVQPLLQRARQQLLQETDYVAEARAATLYRQRLGADPMLMVPAVHPDYCSAHILASDFVAGESVDRMVSNGTSAYNRDRIASGTVRLAVREFFEMRLVQTDPNFGNYLLEANTGRIALLDFGATEEVTAARVAQLRELARALKTGDVPRLTQAALHAGFIAADDAPAQTQGVMELMQMAGEPLRHIGSYDFAASDLFARGFERGQAQFFGAGYARTPPPDLIFLQRKFVGTFMLCARLKARVDLGELFAAQL
jgi:aarF domain-containing kinase